MAEVHLLVIQTVLTALPAGWMALGVLDNIRYPDINRDAVAEVLRMDALADWPEVKARVGHRSIDNPRTIRFLFGIIVVVELTATLLLSAGVLALGGQLLGLWDGGIPHLLAGAGALVFCSVWGGMLIGGQRFYYWYGDHGQHTHMLALIWGIGTLIVLSI